MSSDIYEQMVNITEDYLGPATRRFLVRQISFHLDKRPDEIVATDVPKLIEWTKVTLSLLTEDKSVVDEYARKMHLLAGASE